MQKKRYFVPWEEIKRYYGTNQPSETYDDVDEEDD